MKIDTSNVTESERRPLSAWFAVCPCERGRRAIRRNR